MLNTLGSNLLLRYVAMLGYCVKQLNNWMLSTIKVNSIALSKEVILGVNAVKLVYYVQLEYCRSTTKY